jgi:hypothetical protein
MATTTTTNDAEQRKAEIKSSILFMQYGIIDELKKNELLSRMQIKNINGIQTFVRKPKGNSTIDQPTDE